LFACNCTRSTKQPCTCATHRLPFDEPECSWKLRTTDGDIVTQTYPDEIITAKLPADVQNFIVRKKDGLPAYQLASVVDDLLFHVDFIVRGQDLWSSSLAQLQLAQKLRVEPFLKAFFYHHQLLMSTSDQKLSKSAGDTSIKHLRESGKTPAEIYGMIANLLGKNDGAGNWQDLANLLGP